MLQGEILIFLCFALEAMSIRDREPERFTRTDTQKSLVSVMVARNYEADVYWPTCNSSQPEPELFAGPSRNLVSLFQFGPDRSCLPV